MRYKTVELIVDAKPYIPENNAKYFAEVFVRMRFKGAIDLNIEDRILPEKNRRLIYV